MNVQRNAATVGALLVLLVVGAVSAVASGVLAHTAQNGTSAQCAPPVTGSSGMPFAGAKYRLTKSCAPSPAAAAGASSRYERSITSFSRCVSSS